MSNAPEIARLSLPVIDPSTIKPRKERAFRIKSETITEKLCGNCRFIYYRGINEVTMRIGYCNNYKTSGRGPVKPEETCCPFWSRRGAIKMQNERLHAMSMQEKIGGHRR